MYLDIRYKEWSGQVNFVIIIINHHNIEQNVPKVKEVMSG